MLTGWRKTVSRMFLIPQRYVLGIMGFLAVANAYTMRICLSVAINVMVVPKEESNTTHHVDDDLQCPADPSSGSSNKLTGIYDWTNTEQGLILSSFFWGYVITHLPGGLLAERFGGKYTLGFGILGTAVFTLLTPVVVEEFGATGLIVIRVIEGLGEGTTFPALNSLLAQWAPPLERSKLGSLVFGGAQFGTIVGNALSGVVLHATEDWRSVFYLFGGLGTLWFIIWVMICYNDPASHPFITDSEKEYIQETLKCTSRETDLPPTPWRAIWTSVPLWALICAQIGHDWGFFTMVTDLPKYMNDILKFNISENGLYSALPYVVMWIVSILSAIWCDHMLKKKMLSVTNARKLFTTIASVGPACFIIGASFAGCDKTLVVALFTIGMGFMGTFYAGMKINALDLSPNYAGTLMAIVNGIGALSGIITPYLIEELTPNHSLVEWRVVFWIAFGVFNVTNLVYILFASAETQWWNDPLKNNPKMDVEKEQHKIEDFNAKKISQ
ncbi:putative inorganic phosphate cotransporter [Ctenocephalides felis]|uniref:putative inorganic phosphate cotransporter n=1 Tax=Ctenocephalides felis TaxID=7515 RepID=UPI000E6E1C81|nr:putative inorganic phosphate cotransporter [Ctenocephalides felis]